MDWTIDTNILARSAEGDMNAIEILNTVKRNKSIVLDSEEQILNEYYGCLGDLDKDRGNPTKIVYEWLTHMMSYRKTRVLYCSLTKKEEGELLALKFDTTDIKFVKACKASGTKKMISEDSDYNGIVCSHLKEKFDIDVYNINHCIEYNILED